MAALLLALLSGLLFGLGLTVSSMIDPEKVLGFLDLAGNWDPSLAFVMATAIPVAALGFVLGRKRRAPLAVPDFQEPGMNRIDRPLVLGAILFGLGWGLVGFCPGPALTALGLGLAEAWIFAGSMLVGMVGYEVVKIFLRRVPAA
ncbi:DUF6691 family protein [Telmatospirillum sp. J64-1]|uniref:DUF6691 family protein n=1 Tax=Telmatospirillum sp. J64-1 TaxID=2502183 RepID=UPI00115E3E65|nr:DUF6691 family protein [Telmatospirillum sp. J64-1]